MSLCSNSDSRWLLMAILKVSLKTFEWLLMLLGLLVSWLEECWWDMGRCHMEQMAWAYSRGAKLYHFTQISLRHERSENNISTSRTAAAHREVLLMLAQESATILSKWMRLSDCQHLGQDGWVHKMLGWSMFMHSSEMTNMSERRLVLKQLFAEILIDLTLLSSKHCILTCMIWVEDALIANWICSVNQLLSFFLL